jgi:gliding motility-associated-like protein
MVMRNRLTLGIVLFVAIFHSIYAQLPKLYINEYSAANVGRTNLKFRDFQGASPDWIELYSDETTKSINIGGYYLSDNAGNKKKYRIPTTPQITIPPGGYIVIFCSDKDTVVNVSGKLEVHTNFRLTQTKAKAEEIYLSDNNGNALDNVTIKRNQANHSWGRYFYGPAALSPVKNRKFYVYVRPTPGGFNDSNKTIGANRPVLAYIDYLKSPEMKTQPGFRAKGTLIDFKLIYPITGQQQQEIKYSLTNQIPSLKASGTNPDTVPVKVSAAPVTQQSYTGEYFDPTTTPAADSVYHTFTIKARYVPVDTTAYYYLPSFPITNTYFSLGVADSIKITPTAKFGLTLDSAQKLPIIHISENRYSNVDIVVDPPSSNTPTLISDIPKSKTFRLPRIHPVFADKTSDSAYATVEYFEPGGKRAGVYNGLLMRKAYKKRTIYFEQRNIAFKPDDEYGIAPAAVVDGQKGINYQMNNKFFNTAILNPSVRDEFKKIHFRAAGNDNFFSISDSIKNVNGTLKRDTVRQTHMRDGMVQTYAAKIGLNFETRNYQPVILFVNGRYHGVYDIRETFNNNLTKANFKQDKKNVDIIKYDAIPPSSAAQKRKREGSNADWEALGRFILKNRPEGDNYDYIKSQMSITSLIDYMIYNQYTGNSHFLNTNVGIWRGRSKEGVKQKWRFFAYDMDNVYERSVNVSFPGNVTNTTPFVFTPCSYAEKTIGPSFDSAGIYEIFQRLYDSNFVFKSQYLFRFNSLMDGPLKCDSMVNHFEKVKDLLISQMKRHCANNSKNRYNYNGGQQAVFLKLIRAQDSLREYILRRCNALDSTLRSCDSLVKKKQLVFVKILPDTLPVGEVSVYGYEQYTTNDTMSLRHVFMNTRLDFEAYSTNPSYVFDRWTTTNKKDTIRDTLFSSSMHLKVTKADTIYANFRILPKNELDFPLQFPTAFSPNGDGRNDIFIPIGGGGDIAKYEMQIYNRWGELIYNTYDRNRGWNGKQYGVDAPIGVYVYKITATDINNKKTDKVGNVTLLR